jgi:hypothetical protein
VIEVGDRGCHSPRLVGAVREVGGGEELDLYLEWFILLTSLCDCFAELDDVPILENVGSGRCQLGHGTSRRGDPSAVMASTVDDHDLGYRERDQPKPRGRLRQDEGLGDEYALQRQ